jgi:hypothetical protein
MTNGVPSGRDEPLGRFIIRKLADSARVVVLLVLDGVFILFWVGIDWVLDWVGERVHGHDICVHLLEHWAPWCILVIAVLHLIGDVIAELKAFWRKIVPKNRGENDANASR